MRLRKKVSTRSKMVMKVDYLRLFLFQTLLASGPVGVPGPARGDVRASRTVLATKRGFAAELARIGVGDNTKM